MALNTGCGYQSRSRATGSTTWSITPSATGTYGCAATDFGTSCELATNDNRKSDVKREVRIRL